MELQSEPHFTMKCSSNHRGMSLKLSSHTQTMFQVAHPSPHSPQQRRHKRHCHCQKDYENNWPISDTFSWNWNSNQVVVLGSIRIIINNVAGSLQSCPSSPVDAVNSSPSCASSVLHCTDDEDTEILGNQS